MSSATRFKPAIVGSVAGWSGNKYLTYAEHDECMRHTFAAKSKASKRAMYSMAKTAVIQRREAKP